jgi:hypothetical protein
MNVVLWVVAVVLALAFLSSGALKLSQSKEKLAANGMGWTESYSSGAIKAIGGVEVLGAAGLLLPALSGVAPVLVPLAATGLLLVMIGAAVTHGRRGENQLIVVNLILGVLALLVAWGRFGPYSFR